MMELRHGNKFKAALAAAVVLLVGFAAAPAMAAQGTWTAAPSETVNGGAAFGLWLLTDGSVLSHSDALNHWCKLVPDANGSYANGTWVQLANSAYARGGATEHVLKDGRFLEAGGEYIYTWPSGGSSADQNTVEIYDPVANTWTLKAPGLAGIISDSSSATLSDGTLFYTDWANSNNTQIYNPVTNSWTAKAAKPNNGMGWVGGVEESMASLQNGGVFALSEQTSAVYDPASNSWTSSGSLPFSTASWGDIGGIAQLFDGRVYAMGIGVTGLFTPGSTPTTPGTWANGPALPHGNDFEDEYCVTEPNGKLMFVTYPAGGSPNSLAEFDPTTNAITEITPPPDTAGPYPVSYCNLPNGQVMVCCGAIDWLYTPNGAPQDSWRPTVSSVAFNSGTTYTLTGTQLSGLVNGADEGDDMTMAENYPIVWLTNSTGKVWYCKSFNFSTMMPKAGTAAQTCQFTTPSGLASGTYSLYVSSVGVRSKTAFSFTTGGSSGGGLIANGTYKIQNLADSNYVDDMGLTANGSLVAQYANSSSNNQRWVLTYNSAGYYTVTNVSDGKLLDDLGNSANGSNVGQWQSGTSPNQHWIISASGTSGYYKLSPGNATGQCLDTGGLTANGSTLQLWGNGGSHNQFWKFIAN